MPAISSISRTRPKRCSSASGSQSRKRGQARVQVVQPFWPWMQSSARAPPRGGTACTALFVVVADDVVRAGDHAARAAGAQAGVMTSA
jgi:hypothetical protein